MAVDTSGLRQKVAALKSFVRNDALKVAAAITIQDIRDKTKRGVDPEGTPFLPYQPRYKKHREKHGKQTGHVDLTFSGKLLDGLHYESGQKRVTVRDKDQPRARGLNFGVPNKNVASRPFMSQPGSDTIQRIEDGEAFAIQKILR